MIEGISHITLVVKDLQRSAGMLSDIFDAREIYSSDEKNFSLSDEKFFDIAGIAFQS